MFDVNIEEIVRDDGTVLFRLSWFDGKEHHERWIEKTWEELEDD